MANNATAQAKETVSIMAKLRFIRKRRREMALKIAQAEIALEVAKLREDEEHLAFIEAETKATGKQADVEASLQ